MSTAEQNLHLLSAVSEAIAFAALLALLAGLIGAIVKWRSTWRRLWLRLALAGFLAWVTLVAATNAIFYYDLFPLAPGFGPKTSIAELSQPDPASPPTRDDLKGIWTGVAASPKGDSRREHSLRFADGQHLVWAFTQISTGKPGEPEFRTETVLKGRYEINGPELRFTVGVKTNGIRALESGADKEPRLFEYTRNADGSIRLQPKPIEPGFHWSDATFRRAAE